MIDENVEIGTDVYQHPQTTMDENAEFLTKRPLAVRLIEELQCRKEKFMFPQDPYILLSFVNTKLRDEYPSLSALCDGLDADQAELTVKLAGAGYAYDPDANQFKPV